MIATIMGTLYDKTTNNIIILTSAGVGYEVLISESTLQKLPNTGSEITLYTSLIVREQEMYLVGFPSIGEKNLFEILITAKGIGPKQGLKILGELSGSELRMAIVSGNISALVQIKGISSKKAEQLILDLQEKMKKSIGELSSNSFPQDPLAKQKTEVLLTMRALGYTDFEIKKPLEVFFEQKEFHSDTTEKIVSEFLLYLSQYS